MNLQILDINGKKAGELAADPALFEVKHNPEVVHSTLRWLQNSKRAGTHSTLTRAEVSGGGKKPWKQKGTGRARAGSIRSPLWRHGGVTFGPKPRDYSFSLPAKVRKLALRVALSDRAREGKIIILDSLDVKSPKTKEFVGILSNLGALGVKTLIIVADAKGNIALASRNIKDLKIASYASVNIFDLLNAKNIVITKDAAAKLKERLT